MARRFNVENFKKGKTTENEFCYMISMIQRVSLSYDVYALGLAYAEVYRESYIFNLKFVYINDNNKSKSNNLRWVPDLIPSRLRAGHTIKIVDGGIEVVEI